VSPNKSVHRSLAVLKLPKVIAALVTYAQAIVTAITGNPRFPTPLPTLAVISAAIAALQVAEAAALARTKGMVTARNDKRAVLVALLQQLRTYVQTIADADADNSAAIIQSAGLSVKKTATRKPRVFTVTEGSVSGTAKLVTRSAGPRAAYDWGYTIDAGKTWVVLPSTVQAKTVVTGLPAGTTVLFRFRSVTKSGETDWSQPAALLVR
jgi:hypothetical protein